MRPLDSAIVFDYSVMDAVVVWVMEVAVVHVAPVVAHKVDTSLDRDAVDSAVDAFPM